jgi:hypothetical protein
MANVARTCFVGPQHSDVTKPKVAELETRLCASLPAAIHNSFSRSSVLSSASRMMLFRTFG